MHETDELVMFIEGEIELSFQDKTLCPDIGEEFFIPVRTSHTVRNIGTKSNPWFYGYKHDL